MQIGVIDLGSNSAKFGIHRIDSEGSLTKTFGEKLPTALGREVFRRGTVSSRTAGRIIDACLDFKDVAARAKVDRVAAVATSAFRSARNGRDVADRLGRRTGLQVRLISGREEAQLIALGILKGDSAIPDNCTIVDIGGGSSEVIICRNRRAASAVSFDLGAARLAETYLYPRDARPGEPALKRLQRTIQRRIFAAAARYDWPRSATLVVSSGTAKAVVKYSETINGKNGHGRSGMREVIASLRELSPSEIAQLPGVKARRNRSMLAAAMVLHELMYCTRANRILTTRCSLGEGVVFKLAQQIQR